MKRILVSLIVIVAIYVVRQSAYANVVDHSVMLNAEALFDFEPDEPENPKPEPNPCWTDFYIYAEPTDIPFRICGSDPADTGEASRIGATKCLEIFAYYHPNDASGNICYKQPGPQ